MMTGATFPVVVCTPSRLNPGFNAPLTAAMTSGKYSGKQPAITALAAIFSTVATPFNGGITPSAKSLSNPPAAIISSTAARVGGSTGSPSLQPRLTSSLNKTAGSLETVSREFKGRDFLARLIAASRRRLTLPKQVCRNRIDRGFGQRAQLFQRNGSDRMRHYDERKIGHAPGS